MNKWNPAFLALEHDLQAIQAVLQQYDQWSEQLHQAAAERIRLGLQRRYEVEVCTDDETRAGQWGLSVELDGEFNDAGLDLRTWLAGAYGGPAGRLHVGIYLDHDLAKGMPTLSELMAVVEQHLGDGFIDARVVSPDVLECADASPLCVRGIDCATPDVEDRLARTVLDLVAVAESLAQVLLEQQE